MPMHQVEVDDEVFAFVKSHAEPLVDSFNSALKKLLITAKTPDVSEAPGSRSFPGGTPEALRQILEVVQLVRSGSRRTAATQHVARRYAVATATVQDKYARQLNLSTHQFDRLLDQDDLGDLDMLLKSKFPKHGDVIASWLK